MKRTRQVSEIVIRRLPIYHRYLQEEMDNGQVRISSKELSNKTGFTASQIRQDLNNFGGFGQQGYGYNVGILKDEIAKILGIKQRHNAVIIGAGSLGTAIAKYKGFKSSGLEVRALFDDDENVVGKKIGTAEVLNLKELENFIKRYKVEIAILTIPAYAAQEIADRLVKCGIEGIWNFAPIDLVVPYNVVVENVILNNSLLTLTYYLNNRPE